MTMPQLPVTRGAVAGEEFVAAVCLNYAHRRVGPREATCSVSERRLGLSPAWCRCREEATTTLAVTLGVQSGVIVCAPAVKLAARRSQLAKD
jgi:hypothetical protein